MTGRVPMFVKMAEADQRHRDRNEAAQQAQQAQASSLQQQQSTTTKRPKTSLDYANEENWIAHDIELLRENVDDSPKELAFNNNQIQGFHGCSARDLAGALETNTTLVSLELQEAFCVGDEGARALGAALHKNTTLAKLVLFCNDIGGEGAGALANALKTNDSLASLSLHGNEIGDEGARAIADALGTNTTLATLDLTSCNIGAEGARALADALQKTNTTLATLDLSWNHIGAEGARALADALEKNNNNTGLTQLDVSGNDTACFDLDELMDANDKGVTLTDPDFEDAKERIEKVLMKRNETNE